MDIGQTQCIVRILALLLKRQRTVFDTQVPFKACGPLISNIIFHALYNPGHPLSKMHRRIYHMNSGINYGGLIDWILFYALSI